MADMTKLILATALLFASPASPATRPPNPYAGWTPIETQDDLGHPVKIIIPPGFESIGVRTEWVRPTAEDVRAMGMFRNGAQTFRTEVRSRWTHNAYTLASAKHNRSLLDAGTCYIGEAW